MKYQVIIVLDETRNKSYYHSYSESDDTAIGNIECSDLPPYQDINKAQSCYWDSATKTWVYDEEKYSEIVEQLKAEKEAAEQEALEMSVIMSPKELTDAVIELTELYGGLMS